MTVTVHDEAVLRRWLVDYLITTVGCHPDDIDADRSFNDLGVGSRDAVVLSGELAELLDRPVSPVDFWQHPTIRALVGFLTTTEPDAAAETPRPAEGSLAEEIAVVGVGCRFPGGIKGPDDLWRFLSEGRCSIGEVPADRWLPFDDGSPEAGAALAATTRWGSFLDEIDAFDAEFFEIFPREATKMDPQQRLLLEVAWEALEHAGIAAEFLRRSQTGVFTGACVNEYGYLASSDLAEVDAWSNTGAAVSILSNRLSYFLDLRGPSVAVDTACSSSLVAVHLACQSLRLRECNLAIAAGVNLLLSPAIFRSFDEAKALSPTGRCHAFDASADGFVRGEGCGVVVLKRLSDAIDSGDRVFATVRGSAVNQDGRSNGLMAPNPAAQMAVLRAAYASAGVPPGEVDYVEAHGTGTLLGDPVEARALGTVLGPGRPENSPLLIGSVKTNLGHLEGAAGIAGFIKTVLAVHRGLIPANLDFQTPNPHIPFDQLRLKVVADPQQWPVQERPRRAGVSSFGFGGTNAHVVVEQGPELAVTALPAGSPAVTTLVVSGKSAARIASTAEALADWWQTAGASVGLADVAHGLNHHRSRQGRFATVCARDRDQAVAGLRALAAGRPADGVVGPHEGRCGSGTVFVYSGQGSQWAGMGRQLLADEPAFGEAVAEIDPVFVAEVGFSLQQVLAEGQQLVGIERIQPVLVGVQLALTRLWRSYGVEPDAVIGHSMGEVAAAVVAEALTVAEGLRVIATRSRLMARLSGRGAMALAELDADATCDLIAPHPEVTLAVYASPRQSVIAGPPDRIDALCAALQDQNRMARRIDVDVASHHPTIDPVLPELRAALVGLAPKGPAIPVFSTTYESPGAAPVFDAEHWAANLRNPVRFSQAISAAAEDHCTFVEISAHPLLIRAISDTLDRTHHHSVATLVRDTDDTLTFHTNLNAAHTTRPPWTPHPPELHPVLPTTPWHHASYWISPAAPPTKLAVPSPDRGTPVPPDWCYEPAWRPRPLADPAGAATGSWLLLAPRDLGAEVARIVSGHATVLAPDEVDVADALRGTDVVVYAPESAYRDVASAYRLFDAARGLAAALAGLASPPKLFVLTRNAQPVTAGDRANPPHAALWGLGRTLALEHPEIWGGIVDLDDSVPAELAARYIVAEAGASDGEDQVVYRAGERHVPRLQQRTPPPAPAAVLDPGASHLVIGATGHLGPRVISELADMGATTVVAVSRAPGSRLDKLAEVLSGRGTKLVVVAADATDDVAMGALFDRFGTDLPPLAGIYVAAFAGGPVLLRDMTDDDVRAMFEPKLDAAWLLHTLSLKHPVRQFVLFTSISGLLGSRWLGHYAATTTVLDTFAFARRTMGLAATAINWGWWQSLADTQLAEERRVTRESGLEPMPDDRAIKALRFALRPDASVTSTVVAADWTRVASAYRARGSLRIVDDLLPDAAAPATPTGRFWATLGACRPERRRDLMVDHVGALAAGVMGLPPSEPLDPTAGFFQLGMDSLMSVALQRALSDSLGQSLPPSVIFDYPTVEALSDHLLATFDGGDDEVVDVYEDLTEAELLAELSERLS